MRIMMLLAVLIFHAFAAVAAPSGGESFDVAYAVPDAELASMRGGFISAGGLKFDFALNTRTIIDGVAQNDISIATRALQGINANDLKQLIQVGGGNQVAALDTLAKNPAVLNIVQNSTDGTRIQQFNTLNIDVSNLAAFKNQTLTPEYDFHAVIALR